MNKIKSVKNKNILLLQGPMGTFFKRLDVAFRENGAKTFRIGLNAADAFFSHKDNYTPYKGTPQDWIKFVCDFYKKNNINQIYIFGDCRFYQSIAIQEAKKIGIEVYVFEEGYIRPDFITMQKDGVNAFGGLSDDPDFYKKLELKEINNPHSVNKNTFIEHIDSGLYYFIANLFSSYYPSYVHHKEFSTLKEAFYAIRNLLRKYVYRYFERGFEKKIQLSLNKQYYFIPLQTHTDFQILEHSKYANIEEFLDEVIRSFAKFAPKDKKLLFKHHPVDRGRPRFRSKIMALASKYSIEHRMIIVYDVHLPTILKHSISTITINSTVGLSSVYHQIPTKVMGRAVYDIDGLTAQCSLDEFWDYNKVPDTVLYKKFRYFIVENTQLNGSFYGLFPKVLCFNNDDLSKKLSI